MNSNKKLLKTIVIFTLLMAIISLGYMLVSDHFAQKNQMHIDLDTLKLVQLQKPENGDTIAVIDTSIGQIKAVLYPQYSPNAVKNFIDLANSGYYDNTYVFHSENGIYSAAGSPNKDGTLPDNYDKSKELIKRELNQNLWPFKGAICAMNTTVDKSFWQSLTGGGTYYVGSRFALLNTIDFTDDIKKQLYDYTGDNTLPDAFVKNGGIPNFSQQMTVIGQTYEGIDVIEKLSSLKVSDSKDTEKIPVDDVMIKSVKISKYSEDTTASTTNESAAH